MLVLLGETELIADLWLIVKLYRSADVGRVVIIGIVVGRDSCKGIGGGGSVIELRINLCHPIYDISPFSRTNLRKLIHRISSVVRNRLRRSTWFVLIVV